MTPDNSEWENLRQKLTLQVISNHPRYKCLFLIYAFFESFLEFLLIENVAFIKNENDHVLFAVTALSSNV